MAGEAKFTPGPWKVFRTTDGQHILGIGRADTGEGVTDPRFGLWSDGEEREANGRLIAASPDLLEALRAVCADPTPSAIANGRAAITRATTP